MYEIHEAFFVGGRYVETAGGMRMAGQAYVQRRAPTAHRQPLPIVMIHGAHQTSVNFETTPDGRPGWADFFVRAGFDTYLMDHPGRGRAAYLTDEYGPMAAAYSTKHVEDRFTACSESELWPQAHLHSQWPGKGRAGDPIFDQFYASQVPSIDDARVREQLVRAAGTALVDRIGPAILLTHSQAGPFGWHIADARPGLVKAIVAVEPAGPPFFQIKTVGAPHFFGEGPFLRPYGLTASPITYDPPVADPRRDLPFVLQEPSAADGFPLCYLQSEPAKRLPNLADVPVAVVTAEASNHAAFDHCTVAYLQQCGATVTHVRLAAEGIRGNGHMMMLEKNSDEIAAAICRWLEKRGIARQHPDATRAVTPTESPGIVNGVRHDRGSS